MEIAVIGLTKENSCIEKENNTTCYKVNFRNPNPFRRIYRRFRCEIQDELIIKDYISAILDFDPDLIHIFGVENFLCNIIPHVNCKSVVHLQGLANPYLNAWFPPGISANLFYRKSFHLSHFLRGLGQKHQYRTFQAIAKRELEYFNFIRFFMGRTDWDCVYSQSLSKQSRYFHLDEVLRPDFYTDKQWVKKNRNHVQLLSVLAPATYKGFDVILKTAALLKSRGIRFQWMICGSSEKDDVILSFEKIVKQKYKENNISLLGQKTSQELVTLLLDADIFIHPSYIDNSPNSVCEAQMLGVPVIATNVGGVSSLVDSEETGMLVPANDPYCLSGVISSLLSNPSKMQYLGMNAREVAKKRHDQEVILKNIETIYQEILNCNA